jgi:hypothetical protein
MKKSSTNLTQKTVLQSPLEKAVIEVVEYLVKNWEKHKKVRTRRELFKKLGLSENHWSDVLKSQRHAMPKSKADGVRKILIDEFHVRAGFLDKHTGSMFTDDAEWLIEDPQAAYMTKDQIIKKMEEEVLAVSNEVIELKKNNLELRDIITAQKELIDQLRTSNKKGNNHRGPKVGRLG